MLKAIVFDLDDTLYPERQYALSGFSAVADWAESTVGISRERGYSELVAYFEDGVRGDTFNRWLEAHGIEPELWMPEMVKCYRDHSPSLEPYPETHSVLRSLRGRYRLGLITQGHGPGQRHQQRRLGQCRPRRGAGHRRDHVGPRRRRFYERSLDGLLRSERRRAELLGQQQRRCRGYRDGLRANPDGRGE